MKKLFLLLVFAAFALTAKAQYWNTSYTSNIYPFSGKNTDAIKFYSDSVQINGSLKVTGNFSAGTDVFITGTDNAMIGTTGGTFNTGVTNSLILGMSNGYAAVSYTAYMHKADIASRLTLGNSYIEPNIATFKQDVNSIPAIQWVTSPANKVGINCTNAPTYGFQVETKAWFGNEVIAAINISTIVPDDKINVSGISQERASATSVMIIHGDGGPIDITANPQIGAATYEGQLLEIWGNDDTNTVKFDDGTGLHLGAASRVLGKDDLLELRFIGSVWVEKQFQDN